jgi:hypothetical protein
MPKQRVAHSKIFAEINVKGSVSYGGFLNWVHNTLVAEYWQNKFSKL